MNIWKWIWHMTFSDPYSEYAALRVKMQKIIDQGPDHPQHEDAAAWCEHTDDVLRAFWCGKEATDA